MSPEEDRTRDTVDSEPKHYQRAIPAPDDVSNCNDCRHCCINEEPQYDRLWNQCRNVGRLQSAETCQAELLLYSGHEEDNAPHTQSVTLVLSKTAQKASAQRETH